MTESFPKLTKDIKSQIQEKHTKIHHSKTQKGGGGVGQKEKNFKAVREKRYIFLIEKKFT